MRSFRGAALAALLSTTVLSFGACSANQNYDERQRFADQNPDLYPTTSPDGLPCVDTCTPDPGSKPVDCARAEAGVEFMDPPLFTFDEPGGLARNLYTYTDGSANFLEPHGYQPPVSATDEGTHRCGDPDNQVFHLRGGLFRGWGGGMGTSLNNFITAAMLSACADDPDAEACFVTAVEAPASEWTIEGRSTKAPVTGGAGTPPRQLNASRWDGISFWARRGPGGQAELRVLAGDKHTDDDLNVLNAHVVENGEYLYCKVSRSCDCPLSRPCTTYDYVDPGNPENPPEKRSRCFDPAVDPPPPLDAEADEQFIGGEGINPYPALYGRCGDFACLRGHPTDPQMNTAPLIQASTCNPYTFLSGETRDTCYDPGESPTPAEGYEACGDSWTSTVLLGTDWQFYMVPFRSMRQQGFGKESAKLLTDELSAIRFTWDGGWIDYWLDDVRFYRIRDPN